MSIASVIGIRNQADKKEIKKVTKLEKIYDEIEETEIDCDCTTHVVPDEWNRLYHNSDSVSADEIRGASAIYLFHDSVEQCLAVVDEKEDRMENYEGYIRTESGSVYIQKNDPNSRWGFVICDDDQTWDGGFGCGDSEFTPIAKSEVSEADKERLGWILKAQ
jgi:hypothetical protein